MNSHKQCTVIFTLTHLCRKVPAGRLGRAAARKPAEAGSRRAAQKPAARAGAPQRTPTAAERQRSPPPRTPPQPTVSVHPRPLRTPYGPPAAAARHSPGARRKLPAAAPAGSTALHVHVMTNNDMLLLPCTTAQSPPIPLDSSA